MTKKQVWKYRCDYCKKTGLSAGHMGSHEKRCTANPNRICRMHVNYEVPQRPVSELIGALRTLDNDHGMANLRKLSSNCPMCILAAIRQSGICKWDGDPGSQTPDLEFDFKAELKSAWDTINDAKSQDSEARYVYHY